MPLDKEPKQDIKGRHAGNRMTKVGCSSRTASPLLAIPIIDAELAVIRREGPDVLEGRWMATKCDIMGWNKTAEA